MEEKLLTAVRMAMKNRKTIGVEKTREWLNSQNITFEEKEDGIHIIGDFRPKFMVKYFYLNISFVDGNLDLSRMNLLNFDNVPSCSKDANFSGNNFKTLEGIPNFGGSLNVSGNKNFHSLKGLDKKTIDGNLDVSFTGLQTLNSLCVSEINGNLLANNCQMKQANMGVTIEGNCYLGFNYLISTPKNNVKGDLDLEGNPCQPADSFDSARW